MAHIAHRGLPKTHPANQAANEAMPLAQATPGENDLPAHQAKISGIERDLEAQHGPEQAIELQGGQTLEPGLAQAAIPDGVTDVVAGAPLLQHGRDHLGGVLQVSVHHHHRLALRPVHARGDGDLMAEVARERDHLVERLSLGQLGQQRGRRIARTIVDEDYLPARPRPARKARKRRSSWGSSPPR